LNLIGLRSAALANAAKPPRPHFDALFEIGMNNILELSQEAKPERAFGAFSGKGSALYRKVPGVEGSQSGWGLPAL